jgi:hypothetical protein
LETAVVVIKRLLSPDPPVRMAGEPAVKLVSVSIESTTDGNTVN